MNRPQLFTGVVALALATTTATACNRADTTREARETAAEVRTAAARAGDRLADTWLTAKVQAKFFADDDIKARYIDVTTHEGAVTLKGFVENEAQRQQALQIARGTEGVKQVDDRLLIGQAPQTAGGKTEGGAVPTAGTNTTLVPADSAVLDDPMITSLIQAKYFVDSTLKTRSIDVSTANRVVTLRGQVASDNERAQALLLARTSQGVERVEDSLTVDAALGQSATATSTQSATSSQSAALPSNSIAGAGSAAPTVGAPDSRSGSAAAATGSGAVGTAGARASDNSLETSVRQKLEADAQLKAAGIDVSARDGVVLLQGTVPNQAAEQRALTIARQAEGAVQVVDRITVKRAR